MKSNKSSKQSQRPKKLVKVTPAPKKGKHDRTTAPGTITLWVGGKKVLTVPADQLDAAAIADIGEQLDHTAAGIEPVELRVTRLREWPPPRGRGSGNCTARSGPRAGGS